MGLLDTCVAKAYEAKAQADIERPVAESVANQNDMESFVRLRSVVDDKYTFKEAVEDFCTFRNAIHKS